jgi:uncharacterized membrane protein
MRILLNQNNNLISIKKYIFKKINNNIIIINSFKSLKFIYIKIKNTNNKNKKNKQLKNKKYNKSNSI